MDGQQPLELSLVDQLGQVGQRLGSGLQTLSFPTGGALEQGGLLDALQRRENLVGI